MRVGVWNRQAVSPGLAVIMARCCGRLALGRALSRSQWCLPALHCWRASHRACWLWGSCPSPRAGSYCGLELQESAHPAVGLGSVLLLPHGALLWGAGIAGSSLG